MQKQVSIAEAKNKLSSIVHSVERGPCVELTRRGKPVAILLSIKEYQKLSSKNPGFWNALRQFRENIKAEGIEIDGSFFDGLRDTDPGRHFELDT